MTPHRIVQAAAPEASDWLRTIMAGTPAELTQCLARCVAKMASEYRHGDPLIPAKEAGQGVAALLFAGAQPDMRTRQLLAESLFYPYYGGGHIGSAQIVIHLVRDQALHFVAPAQQVALATVVLRRLAECGVDLDGVDRVQHRTPMEFACAREEGFAMTEALMRCGVDPMRQRVIGTELAPCSVYERLAATNWVQRESLAQHARLQPMRDELRAKMLAYANHHMIAQLLEEGEMAARKPL